LIQAKGFCSLHFIEQREIEAAKVGALLSWDDTRKMKYTWQVIQETMRIQPIAQMGNRLAIKEFEYGGFTIPKGWKVWLDLNKYFVEFLIFEH
jgi:cytochrome P450 family 26 subfamily A